MHQVRAAIQVIVLSLTAAVSNASQPPTRRASPPPKRVTATSASYSVGKPPVNENSSFAKLSPISITNNNTRKTVSLRLYDSSGAVDEQAAEELDSLLCDARDRDNIETITIDRRLLQLVYRAAYHFSSDKVEVVSAYRKAIHKREGMHAQGRAMDFRLSGVKALILAAYLRTIPRVGVGIYTHPKTQFVHLDVRDQSFHWLDASPPRRHWREMNIGGKALIAQDAKYSRKDDWPEGTTPVLK